jgi:hypothetical protein
MCECVLLQIKLKESALYIRGIIVVFAMPVASQPVAKFIAKFNAKIILIHF